MGREKTDIFHFHVIANATDFDEESLEVNRDLFLHSFSEFTPVSRSITIKGSSRIV